MTYKVSISPRAQKEIENAIEYYALYSETAPRKFIHSLKFSYEILSINPFFALVYKNVRGLKIKRFPFSLFYVVDEKQKTLKILSCFHNKRNPNVRPK